MIYRDDNIHTALEKKAALSKEEKGMLSGAGIGGALGAALLLRSKAGLRAEARQFLKGLGRGGSRGVEAREATKRGLPPQAIDQAKQVAGIIRAKGLDPRKINIAVSGAGGTGKSTFVSALSKELDMPGIHLDRAKIDYVYGTGLKIKPYLHKEQNKLSRGAILEQTHLMTKIDPRYYDVAVHLERPTAVVRGQTLARGRGAAQLDMYDYNKVKGTIRHAFDTLPGKTMQIDDVVRVKVAPKSGFNERRLDAALQRAGIKTEVRGRPMSREMKLLSLYDGKPVRSSRTWRQYLDSGTVASIPSALVGAPAAGAAVGFGAMKAPDAIANMRNR